MPTERDDDGFEKANSQEPRIASPEEDTKRAGLRVRQQDREISRHWPWPKDPLRQPGESAPAPDKRG